MRGAGSASASQGNWKISTPMHPGPKIDLHADKRARTKTPIYYGCSLRGYSGAVRVPIAVRVVIVHSAITFMCFHYA